jgi:hypothetical protein
MPITTQWDNDEQTAVRWDFQEGWTWDEFRSVVAESKTMFRTVPHRVDIIANMETCRTMPPNAFLHYRRADSVSEPNRGNTVIVSDRLFIKTVVSMSNQIFKRRTRELLIAETVEEARLLLAGLRQAAAGE